MTITLHANEGHYLVCEPLDPAAETLANYWIEIKVSDITPWREVTIAEYDTYRAAWHELHPEPEPTEPDAAEEGGEQ